MGLSRLLPGRLKRFKHQSTGLLNEGDETSSSGPAVPDLGSTAVPGVTTPPSSTHALWARAYEILEKREPDLMADYRTHLASLQPDSATGKDLSTQQFVKSIVEKLIEDREEKQWRVTLLGRDIKIREQAEKLSKFLLWADDVVKKAINTQPHAALAWSGVTLLLPLLASGTTQNTALIKGFGSVGDIQVYWDICSRIYLQPPHQQLYHDLVEPLAELYSHIVEYQARIICHFSSAQISRAWQNVAGWNDWAGKAAEIEDLSQRCGNRIPHLNEKEIRERWSRLQQQLEESRKIRNEILHTIKKHVQDDKETRLLHHLAQAARSYESEKNRVPEKVPGTCEWFLADERFYKWRDSGRPGFFWVSAGPGCGKTVLSRTLIDDGHLATNATTITVSQFASSTSVATSTGTMSTVCYFFFKDGGDGPMNGAQALCAILHQLFTRDATAKLIRSALTSHKNFGEPMMRNFSELWRILLECARSSDGGDIVCILDALDECKDDSKLEIIDALRSYCSSPTSGIKFLITSRPYEDLEISFRRFPTTAAYLRFDGDEKAEQISHEIDLVIDFKMKRITEGFSDEHRQRISERLKHGGHRTYLWLYLTLDIIENRPSQYSRLCDIEDLLSDLPSGVPEAYEKILSRSQDVRRTEILLQIVLAAARPLTLDEANIAMTLALHNGRFTSISALESQRWATNKFRDVVTSLCGLFITVFDSKLSFIHQTAREFLTHSKQGQWQGRLSMTRSHTTLSLVCLHYLLLCHTNIAMDQQYFVQYAANYWPSHFVSQDENVASQYRKDARTLCNVTEPHSRVWMENYAKQGLFQLHDWTDLALASYFGLTWVVNDILYERTDLDTVCGYYGTALQAAARRGNLSIVENLLDKGADVNKEGGQYGSALQAAATRGHREMVQKLLKCGAKVNQDAGYYGTPLQAASAKGHAEIVKELLKNGANVDQEGGFYGTALLAASANGHSNAISELLRSGADINKEVLCEDWERHAIVPPHEVEMFEPDRWEADDGPVGTALQAAAAANHVEVVEKLFVHGAAINQECGRYGTALQAASAEGCLDTVEALLRQGADVTKSNGVYGPALFAVAEMGWTEIVDVLLDHGADVHQNTHGGGSPLYIASMPGRDEIYKKLCAKAGT